MNFIKFFLIIFILLYFFNDTKVEWSSLANNSFLKHLNIWVFGVGSKLVPCVLLTYLSFSLIHVLIETDKRKRRLREGNKLKQPSKPSSSKSNAKPNSQINNLTSPKKLSNSLSLSTDGPLEVTHLVDMTQLNRSTDKQLENKENDKCLLNSTDQQPNETEEHFEDCGVVIGVLPASSDSDQTTGHTSVHTTLDSMPNNQDQTTRNFDCNNNPDGQLTIQLDNQPLSVHGSMNDTKEQINKTEDEKPNSTSNASKHSVLKSFSRDLNSNKKSKNDKLVSSSSTTPNVVTGFNQTNQTPTTIQTSNVYLQSTQSSDRTTKMLISVLLIFLLTELPSGILILLSSIIGKWANRSNSYRNI